MEKGINLRIQETKENIANVINDAKLPPGVMQMILESFVTQIQNINSQMINVELEAYKKEGVENAEAIH